MGGINRVTGRPIAEGWQHTVQSVETIFKTVIGERVMRRDFGSDIPHLIDRPGTQDRIVDVIIAAAKALRKWEPRFEIRTASIDAAGPDGVYEITVNGRYYPRGHLADFSYWEDERGLRFQSEVGDT